MNMIFLIRVWMKSFLKSIVLWEARLQNQEIIASPSMVLNQVSMIRHIGGLNLHMITETIMWNAWTLQYRIMDI